MLVDSHAHTYDLRKGYQVPPDIVPVVVGYSHGSNRKAAEDARAHGWPLVLGIAPQTAIREDLSKLDEWVSFIRVAKPNAIGEIGLDYKWAKDGADIAKERLVFGRMLALAQEMELPLVIHSRNRPDAEAGKAGVPEDAVEDILAALAGKGVRFVMHFYSGTAAQAERIVAMGGYISVTHMRSKERRKVINTVPLDRLMAETDSPFVGRTPEAVRDAVSYIAEVKGIGAETAGETTAANAKRFFGF
jgi:Tat protein secretion system quality control protein TatD with DNase activity